MRKKAEDILSQLRRQAKELAESSGTLEENANAGMSLDKLVQELRIAQFELEIQNEELVRAQEELERSRDLYQTLHDYAPMGYITVSENGAIRQANLRASLMLGRSKPRFANRHYRLLLDENSKQAFAEHLEELFSTSRKSRCRVVFLRSDGGRIPVQVESVIIDSPQGGERLALCALLDLTDLERTERELGESRDRFASFMRNLPAMAFIKDLEGAYIYVNEACEDLLDDSPENRIGKTDEDLWPPEVAENILANDRRVIETGVPVQTVEAVALPGKEDRPLHHLVSKFPIRADGRVVALGGFALDITRQVRAEEALRESERRYRIVADNTHDLECWQGPDGSMLYVSPSCERITGYTAEEFVDDPGLLKRLIHRDDLKAWEAYNELLPTMRDRYVDYRIFTRKNRVRWLSQVSLPLRDQSGEDMGVRSSIRDITDRKFMERQMEIQALHDSLTGLANRTLCLDRLSLAMERARRRDNYFFAVFFMDIDRFKVINDSLGHLFGDELLVQVAERLLQCVRRLDTVSRYGSDDFIILLEELSSPREAIQVIKHIRKQIQRPFLVKSTEVRITASYGIVLSPTLYERPEDLLQNASIAMHRAKELGPNRFKVFTARMLEYAVIRMEMEGDLRRGIEQDEFHLAYQPYYDLRTGVLEGFEALVRWDHPGRGLLMPDAFIPVAEESGLIVDLGEWVLHRACADMAQWNREEPGAQRLSVSVNISPRQFAKVELVDRIAAILDSTGLDPANLRLEITETTVMSHAETTIKKLARLKDLGVSISIDDFGTGYSSMSYLQRFPLDILKIDLTFVRKMDTSLENLEIVRAIINLAHSLKLSVVAEGVEKKSQEEALSRLECEYVQGFLYAGPLDREKARGLIGGPALAVG